MTKRPPAPPPPWLAELLVSLVSPRAERGFVLGDFREMYEERMAGVGLRRARRWYWRETLRSLGPIMQSRWQSRGRGPSVSGAVRVDWLRDLAADARYVGRTTSRSPAIAVAIALTLGLGIGAAATMYGVIDRLLLRGPEGVVDPASIRRVYAHVRTKASGEFTTSYLGYVSYTTLRDHARSVAQSAAYNVNDGRIGRGVEAVMAHVGAATADFFPLLGVRPTLGRFFTPQEDAPPDGQRMVVLDYGYWQREFGGARSAIGRTVIIDDQPFIVIGVAPAGFTGVELRRVDLWIPMSASAHPRSDWPTTWRAQWLNVVIRPKPRLSRQQIDEDLTATFRASYAGSDQEWTAADISGRSIAFTAAGTERPEASIARWLAAVALLVLVIAGANVANLLLVRALRRHHEISIRLALGIGRMRLARLLAMESLAYAALGGAVSIAIAYAGGETMHRIFLPNVAWGSSPITGRVVLLAVVLTGVVGTLISLAPIGQALPLNLATALRTTIAASSARSSGARRGLLILQTALSMTLLIGAGLFIRSLSNVRHLDLGVEPERVLVVGINWPRLATPDSATRSAERARRANAWRELRDRVAREPGVSHAAIAVGSPFGNGFGVDIRIPGRDTLPVAPGGGPYVSAVGVDYFATAGTPLVRGRDFLPADGPLAPRVAIVNQTMAALAWPNEDALGKCIIIDDHPCSTVVGIVRDARRYSIQEPASMQYYIPFGQETGFGGAVLLVRPSGDARAFEATLRHAVGRIVPDAKYINVSSMQDRVDPQIRRWRLGATMFGLFGIMALGIAAIGLYSVIAYATAQRTHEFGVRLAIGSDGTRLMRGVLYDGLRLAGWGLVAGLAVALVAGDRVAPLLFNVSPRDPVVFLVVAATLIVVSMLASLVPAWRAARTDPVIALRTS
jgi:putative ABC transport system permease protein